MYADEEVGSPQDGRPKITVAKLDEGRLGAIGSRMSQGFQRPIYDGQADGKEPIEKVAPGVRDDRAMREAARKALAWQRAEEQQMGIGPPSQYATPLSRGQFQAYHQDAVYNPQAEAVKNPAFNPTAEAQAFYHPGQGPTGGGARSLARRPLAEATPFEAAVRVPSSSTPMLAEGPPLAYKSGEPVRPGDVFVDHTKMLSKVVESFGGKATLATPTMGSMDVGADYMKRCNLLRRG